jgi:hypothetical protein
MSTTETPKKNLNNIIYFLGFFILIWTSGQVTAWIFLHLTPSVQDDLLKNETYSILELFFILIFSPILESFILAYCISIARQTIKPTRLTPISSVIPICLLHAIEYWQLAFLVLLPFYFQALAYIRFRKDYSLVKSIAAITMLHSMSNFLTLYAIGAFSYMQGRN